MKLAFFSRSERVLDMVLNWRQLEQLYDDMKHRPPRDPLQTLEIGDLVKKVTGDYHVRGYVVAVFRTRFLLKLRYVVEISADGGGSFCHIYAPSNLELIERPAPIRGTPSSIIS